MNDVNTSSLPWNIEEVVTLLVRDTSKLSFFGFHFGSGA